jgi:3-hydroxyacyl-CoA dehydrogenase/enoyl-CoA hydratase/3-hydroxybutyryl-CoA epimerase
MSATSTSESGREGRDSAGTNWQLEVDSEGLAWLCLDKQSGSTNVLTREVLFELESVVAGLAAAPPTGLIIYSGKSNGFIAGADVNEFPDIDSEADAYDLVRRGQRIFDALEQLPCPSVAVIDGFALGGGLELALACTYRLAIAGDQRTLGLPEVQLGLHPGFGGTIRAVHLLGVRQAMPLMLTGKSVRPSTAQRIGLVDGLVSPEDWRVTAAKLTWSPPPRRSAPLIDRLLAIAPLRAIVAPLLRRQTAKQARIDFYPAPFAIIDLWHRYGARGKAAFEAEARSFARLIATPTSRNLVRVFFLQDRLKQSAGTRHGPANHVHVVGAGLMGGDIAAWCAFRGLKVTLQDREEKYVAAAVERADSLFTRRIKDAAKIEAARGRLVSDVSGNGVATADVIIEAIFEDLEAKQAVYHELEGQMQPGALLATNTSSIPLEQLASKLESPGRLIGLHFFNPVALMPLVEVVQAEQSAPEAVAAATAFARQIGKLPLPTASTPGFLVNRVLAPYMGEAIELIAEGVAPTEIDAAATDFGMPMGPIELADSVGLDIALHVSEILAGTVGRDVPSPLQQLVQAGKLGRKSGQGFYAYKDGRPVKPRSSRQSGTPDLQDRLMLALLNEAAACLHDEVVADADLVDAGVIFGTGFAPFRGGPLHYACETGIKPIVAALGELETRYGQRFRPSPGWQELERRQKS